MASESIIFFEAAVIVLIIMFFWIKAFGPRATKRRTKTKEISVESDRNVIRQVMSKFEILQSNKYATEIQKYMQFNEESLKSRNKEKFWQTLGYDGSVFFVNLLRVGIIALVGYAVFQHTSSISDFVLIATLTGVLAATISDLSTIGKSISDNLIHIEKLRRVFDDFTLEQSLDE